MRMAETPIPVLEFGDGCPDCGRRTADLPPPLPHVGDDFDWHARDYDGFRVLMLEELAARVPGRRTWKPADLEVVLIEAFAAVLDQLSDMLDRVTAETTLETARRPESVRRLLSLLGHDAVAAATATGEIDPTVDPRARAEALDHLWSRHPERMDRARREGPRRIRTQRRMVTLADHADRLAEHPLIARATARSAWSGSWSTVHVAVITADGRSIDTPGPDLDDAWQELLAFHRERGLPDPVPSAGITLRALLVPYLEAYRMLGQEVVLQDAVPVPITLTLSVRVDADHFRSEVRRAIAGALGTGPGGFFAPGRLRFGEDLHASDVLEAVMELDGVVNACLDRFKRLGSQYPDEAETTGRLVMDGLEIPVCDDDPARPERGYWRLHLHGGRAG
jgi:hypothetical protein